MRPRRPTREPFRGEPVQLIGLVGMVADEVGDQRCEQRDEHDARDHDRGGDRDAIATETRPGKTARALRLNRRAGRPERARPGTVDLGGKLIAPGYPFSQMFVGSQLMSKNQNSHPCTREEWYAVNFWNSTGTATASRMICAFA